MTLSSPILRKPIQHRDCEKIKPAECFLSYDNTEIYVTCSSLFNVITKNSPSCRKLFLKRKDVQSNALECHELAITNDKSHTTTAITIIHDSKLLWLAPLTIFHELRAPCARINSNKLIWHKAHVMNNTVILRLASQKGFSENRYNLDKYRVSHKNVYTLWVLLIHI
jgi:hypothetical protein